MPRRKRCVLPDVPSHIKQRGVDRRDVFSGDEDRITYLRLLRENLGDAGVRILGYCLMTNHVHLIAVPAREDSLSILFPRLHGRYAQYYNVHAGRSGHLWQNRFFACMLGQSHLWAALAYVERTPVRAGMVHRAEDYPWSSAAAHLAYDDPSGVLDLDWWRREGPKDWKQFLEGADRRQESALRSCTYAEKSFGEESFVREMAERFGRYWNRGRPKKKKVAVEEAERSAISHGQVNLF